MTDLEICNLALGMLGQDDILEAELTTPTTKSGGQCAKNLQACRQTVLKAKDWTFATKWEEIEQAQDEVSAPPDPYHPYPFCVPDALEVRRCAGTDGLPLVWTKGTGQRYASTGTVLAVASEAAPTRTAEVTPVGVTSGEVAPAGTAVQMASNTDLDDVFTSEIVGRVLYVSAGDFFVSVDSYDSGTDQALGTLLSDMPGSWPYDLEGADIQDWASVGLVMTATNEESVLVKYTYDCLSAGLPDDVAHVVATLMASRMAVPLTENTKLKETLYAEHKALLRDAANADGMGAGSPQVLSMSSGLLAKRRG